MNLIRLFTMENGDASGCVAIVSAIIFIDCARVFEVPLSLCFFSLIKFLHRQCVSETDN